MTSPKVGVFPLGPAPEMQAEIYRLKGIIRELVGGMQRIRREVNNREFENKTYGEFWSLVHTGRCIICGKDRGDKSNDLDTLFCSFHCPICSGWEVVLDVKSA